MKSVQHRCPGKRTCLRRAKLLGTTEDPTTDPPKTHSWAPRCRTALTPALTHPRPAYPHRRYLKTRRQSIGHRQLCNMTHERDIYATLEKANEISGMICTARPKPPL